jgi:hypothetical protein
MFGTVAADGSEPVLPLSLLSEVENGGDAGKKSRP